MRDRSLLTSRFFRSALAIILVTCGCRANPETRRAAEHEGFHPSVERVETLCPYEHKAVRRVKVLYGLLLLTPELRKSVDAREVVLGGCTVFESSPDHVHLCSTCGFQFDPVTEDWIRESSDARSFQHPISSTVLEFEIPSRLAPESLHYAQHYRDGQFTGDSVEYWTTEAKGDLHARIAAYVDAREGQPRNTAEEADLIGQSYELSIGGVSAELDVFWTESGEGHVSLECPPPAPTTLRNPSEAVKLELGE